MSRSQILPSVLYYAGRIASAEKGIRNAGTELSCGSLLLTELCAEIDKMNDCVHTLSDALSCKPKEENPELDASYMHNCVLPAMSALRAAADHLERITDRRCWPFPTYDELLFSVQ